VLRRFLSARVDAGGFVEGLRRLLVAMTTSSVAGSLQEEVA
jgi:hypothetical protein